jgi:hypothetical protein
MGNIHKLRTPVAVRRVRGRVAVRPNAPSYRHKPCGGFQTCDLLILLDVGEQLGIPGTVNPLVQRNQSRVPFREPSRPTGRVLGSAAHRGEDG